MFHTIKRCRTLRPNTHKAIRDPIRQVRVGLTAKAFAKNRSDLSATCCFVSIRSPVRRRATHKKVIVKGALPAAFSLSTHSSVRPKQASHAKTLPTLAGELCVDHMANKELSKFSNVHKMKCQKGHLFREAEVFMETPLGFGVGNPKLNLFKFRRSP